MCILTIKISHGRFFFFWSASFKADFLTLFPISDFRTIKFSIKMVKGAIHRNRFVKRINCIKVSKPFNPQFNVFLLFFSFLKQFSVWKRSQSDAAMVLTVPFFFKMFCRIDGVRFAAFTVRKRFLLKSQVIKCIQLMLTCSYTLK